MRREGRVKSGKSGYGMSKKGRNFYLQVSEGGITKGGRDNLWKHLGV